MHGVGLWKNIRKGLEKFSTHTRFDEGDGSKASLWHDLWCGDKVLKACQFYVVLLARMMHL